MRAHKYFCPDCKMYRTRFEVHKGKCRYCNTTVQNTRDTLRYMQYVALCHGVPSRFVHIGSEVQFDPMVADAQHIYRDQIFIVVAISGNRVALGTAPQISEESTTTSSIIVTTLDAIHPVCDPAEVPTILRESL